MRDRGDNLLQHAVADAHLQHAGVGNDAVHEAAPHLTHAAEHARLLGQLKGDVAAVEAAGKHRLEVQQGCLCREGWLCNQSTRMRIK